MTDRIAETLEKLSAFGRTADGGVTRLPFTAESEAAAQFLLQYFREAGFRAFRDATGAVHGISEDPAGAADLPRILIGSHYDSVVNGGRFDGVTGVVCAAEAVRAYREAGGRGLSPEVIATNDEEGVRFSRGFLTSTAMCDGFSDRDFAEIVDLETGETLGQVLAAHGCDPEAVKAMKDSISGYDAFLEVHIEQGPVLYKNGEQIGVVTGINGIRRFLVTFRGEANHAGSTPMNLRKDAFYMAAQVVQYVYDEALRTEGVVATVGHAEIFPNAQNVIPCEVTFTIDMRSADDGRMETLAEKIRRRALDAAEQAGGSVIFRQTMQVPPVAMSGHFLQLLADACAARQLSFCRMESGAGHDAEIFGRRIPAGMLFVPSIRGISHNPAEESRIPDIAAAAEVLRTALVMYGDESAEKELQTQ